jgi:hypothetical protein
MYTCDKCGKEFLIPVMVDTGGEYGNTPYTEPASPCCEESFGKVTCDVCGSADISEVPHMGRNCNACHPF